MNPTNCETLLSFNDDEIITTTTDDYQDHYDADKIYRQRRSTSDSHNLLLTQHLLHPLVRQNNPNEGSNSNKKNECQYYDDSNSNSNIHNRKNHDDFSKDTRIITTLFLSLAHLGLIVGSYVSTWSDVYMTINEDNNNNNNESSSGDEDDESAVEIPIKTGENLWSFIKLFFESNAAIISILIIISAVCLPIYQIIQHFFLIHDIVRHTKTSVVGDCDNPDDDQQQQQQRQIISEDDDAPRCTKNLSSSPSSSSSIVSQSTRRSLLFFEITSKIASSVTMVSLWLLIAVSIHLTVVTSSGTNVRFQIIGKTKGGTVAFLLGANAGIGTVVLLRHVLDLYVDVDEVASLRDEDGWRRRRRRRLVPLRSSATTTTTLARDEGGSLLFPHDDDDDVSDDVRATLPSSSATPTRGGIFLQRLLFYQSAGISTMLYPLTFFFLPLVRWDYSGIGASFLAETSREMTLIQAGGLVWRSTKGMTYSVVVTALFWAMVVILPTVLLLLCLLLLLATFFCVDEEGWDEGSSEESSFIMHDRRRMTSPAARRNEWALAAYRLLRFLYPFANVVTFAVSTIVIAYEMELVSDYLFDSNALCEKLGSHRRDDVACLVIKGMVLDGGWYCLVQSVCLEVFAYLTIARFKIV